jgi:hypothetical protein
VDGAVDGFEELPKRCGGGVTEDRAGTTSEHCSHEASVKMWGSVSHDVDALVDAIQLSFANTNRDRLGAQPTFLKLPPRHYAVLPRGDPRDLSVGCVAFCAHMDA